MRKVFLLAFKHYDFFRTRKAVHRYWKAGEMDKKGVS
jgi:hypothetical protein